MLFSQERSVTRYDFPYPHFEMSWVTVSGLMLYTWMAYAYAEWSIELIIKVNTLYLLIYWEMLKSGTLTRSLGTESLWGGIFLSLSSPQRARVSPNPHDVHWVRHLLKTDTPNFRSSCIHRGTFLTMVCLSLAPPPPKMWVQSLPVYMQDPLHSQAEALAHYPDPITRRMTLSHYIPSSPPTSPTASFTWVAHKSK